MWRANQETGQHNGVFAAGKRYIATVRLTAASGYTFEGVDTKDFGYTGATVSTTDEPLLLTIDFPETSSVQAIPVSDKDLTYLIPKPVSGGAPLLYFSGLEYSGKVSWESVSTGGLFRAGTVYTAKVTLFARTGYTFDKGLTANFFTHTLATTVTNADNTTNTASIEVKITFPQTEGVGEKVSHLDLTGFILAPKKGEMPTSYFSDEQYSGGIMWQKSGVSGQYSGLFAGGTAYIAKVTLTAASGYTFNGIPVSDESGAFTYTGGTISHPAGTGTTLNVTISFPATNSDVTVTELDLSKYVPKPSKGTTPMSYVAGTQYNGGMTWEVKGADGQYTSHIGDPFKSSTVYRATVTLTPASGYTFNGLQANAFTYPFTGTGGTISHQAGTDTPLIVTITFPATVPETKVDDLNLAVKVYAPADGQTPIYFFSAFQYSGSVEWTPDPAAANPSTFDDELDYTAKVTLTPVLGYTFDGLVETSFKHVGAKGVVFEKSTTTNTGVVTLTFPATLKQVGNDDPSAPKELDLAKYLTAPKSGSSPVTNISGTMYTADVVWKEGAALHSGVFLGGHIYTAEFTLKAKTGYTFAGTPASGNTGAFYHSGGGTVTHEAGTELTGSSLAVTVVFPKTDGNANPKRLSFKEILTSADGLEASPPAFYFIVSGGNQEVVPPTQPDISSNTNSLIDGDGAEITVTANGTIIKLDNSKQSLTLKNITFTATSTNTLPLFEVSGGKLILENVTIQGGKVGVLVNGGTLEINTGTFIGGATNCVEVKSGTVNMNNGTISGDDGDEGLYGTNDGRGVSMTGGTFNMNNGAITKNTPSNDKGTADNGGGVSMTDGTFNMNGGVISANTAKSGGGVYMTGGEFKMSGGTISDNTASGGGGGVYVSSGTFTKSGGGEISGNTATNGNQVYVKDGGKKRNSTAGSDVNLDSTKTKDEGGGWE